MERKAAGGWRFAFWDRSLPRPLQDASHPELAALLAASAPVVDPATHDELWNTDFFTREDMWDLMPPRPWGVLMYNDEAIAGLVQGANVETTDPETKETVVIAVLDQVTIHPAFRSRGLCRPLVRYALQQVFARYPDVHYAEVMNGSVVQGGTPACFCYLHAGRDAGSRVTGALDVWRYRDQWCTVAPKLHNLFKVWPPINVPEK